MKKILSFILTVVFMTSGISYAKVTDRTEASTDNTSIKTAYGYKEAEFLNKLGIIDEIPELSLEVSRGEMCEILGRLLFSGSYMITDSVFSDVTEETLYAKEINALYHAGYVSGYSDGYFRPENVLSYSEAATLYIKALGFRASNDYISTASELGLGEGVKNNGNALTYADLYVLTVNMLNTEIIDNTNNEYKKSDKTFLEDRFNVFDYEGVVTDNGITTIKGKSTVRKTELKVDNETYEWGDVADAGFLGMYVKGYYKLDRDETTKTLITADINYKKTEFIKVDVSEIEKLTLTRLEYFENQKLKTEKISVDADYIYNGLSTQTLTQKTLDEISIGDITVIDRNSDGEYDILFVNSYKTMVVSTVNADEKWLFGKYNEKIDLSEKEDIFVYRDGKEIKLSTLHDYDVIAILENDEAWTAWVVNDAVYGKVSETNSENGLKFIIEGEEYSYAEEYKNSTLPKPEIGSEGMFYLTLQNKIAYFENASTDITIGYLHKIIPCEEYEEETDVVLFEIFGSDNKWRRIKAADKIILNGTTVKKENITKNTLLYTANQTVRNPVKYEINKEGKLSSVQIPDSKCPDEDVLQSAGAEVNLHYSSGTGVTLFLSADAQNIPQYYVNAKTVCFSVPQDPKDKEYYNAEIKFNGSNDKFYTISGYYLTYDNKKMRNLDILVQTEAGEAAKYDSENRISTVKSISRVLNEDNEVCDRLTVVRRGIEYTYDSKNAKQIRKITSVTI